MCDSAGGVAIWLEWPKRRSDKDSECTALNEWLAEMQVYQWVRKRGKVKVVSMKYPLCLQDTGILRDSLEDNACRAKGTT